MSTAEILKDTKAQAGKELRLFKQQLALYSELYKRNQRMALMYKGALWAINNPQNPEHLAQAAHSIRELLEKTPRMLNIPIKALEESMKNKAQNIEGVWQSTRKMSDCVCANGWEGQIDKSLRDFLKKLEEFFNWLNLHHPRRKNEIASTLRQLDGSGKLLPEQLEQININKWIEIRDYYVSVAHHRSNPELLEEFPKWLDALEIFLLDMLCPRTFEEYETIDKLIAEGESNA